MMACRFHRTIRIIPHRGRPRIQNHDRILQDRPRPGRREHPTTPWYVFYILFELVQFLWSCLISVQQLFKSSHILFYFFRIASQPNPTPYPTHNPTVRIEFFLFAFVGCILVTYRTVVCPESSVSSAARTGFFASWVMCTGRIIQRGFFWRRRR